MDRWSTCSGKRFNNTAGGRQMARSDRPPVSRYDEPSSQEEFQHRLRGLRVFYVGGPRQAPSFNRSVNVHARVAVRAGAARPRLLSEHARSAAP